MANLPDSRETQLAYQLLDFVFDEEGLEVFCARFFPQVIDRFSQVEGKAAKIQILVTDQTRRGDLKPLVTKVREVKPEAFQTFVKQQQNAPAKSATGTGISRATGSVPSVSSTQSSLIQNPERFIDKSLEGRYRITEILDKSGLGAVFKAYDTKLRLEVAVKIIDLNLVKEPALRERVRREVKTAKQLAHPNVVHFYDFGESRSLLYIIMEFIAGASLAEARQYFHPLTKNENLKRLIQLMEQICLTVDYLHQQRVLHPGTKPGNIMLRPTPGNDDLPWQPVLINLGLLRPHREAMTAQGKISERQLIYSVSPELLLDHATDTRSDVYALGILLYDLAVGQPPFRPKNLAEAERLHIETAPPSPQLLNPQIPAKLEQVILKALAKDPADRYLNVRSMAQALRECIELPQLPVTPAEITISTETPQLTVTPGERLTTAIRLYNRGKQVEHCQIRVRGAPAEWMAISPSALTLTPGAQEEVELNIQPPRTSEVRAKHHALTIQVMNQRDQQQIDEAKVALAIARYVDFTSNLWPPELSAGQTTQVTIENQGNASETFTIIPKPERGLTFKPGQHQLKLAPGEQGMVNFQVMPQARLIGEPLRQTFSVEVSLPSGQKAAHAGQVTSRGVLSARLVLAALLGLTIFICVVLSFYGLFSGVAQDVTAGAELATAQAQEATRLAINSQQNVATLAAQQTGQAMAQATATAEIQLAADPDRDGLTNAEEATSNTLPDNPDTDQDGLSDGKEVNEFGSNPLDPDTDTDGIPDGEEVRRGLDPNNPDQDNDGIRDGIDPDPQRLPTPTLTPDLAQSGSIVVQFDPRQFTPIEGNVPPRYEVREDAGRLLITVELSRPASPTLLIDYDIIGSGFLLGPNRATAETDFTARLYNGTLVFEPGQQTRQIELDIIDDSDAEGAESLYIDLENRSGIELDILQPRGEIIILPDNND